MATVAIETFAGCHRVAFVARSDASNGAAIESAVRAAVDAEMYAHLALVIHRHAPDAILISWIESQRPMIDAAFGQAIAGDSSCTVQTKFDSEDHLVDFYIASTYCKRPTLDCLSQCARLKSVHMEFVTYQQFPDGFLDRCSQLHSFFRFFCSQWQTSKTSRSFFGQLHPTSKMQLVQQQTGVFA